MHLCRGPCQAVPLCAAYTFGVLMGVLASNGLMSLDQQAPDGGAVPMSRGRGRPATAPSRAVLEILAIQWKRQMQLQGSGKDASRNLAAAILPTLADDLKCALTARAYLSPTLLLQPGRSRFLSTIFQVSCIPTATPLKA